MRLTKIKLAGFKSFVDPTTFRFPSSMVGIVGPNGCGKSNLIDAVRWVMGESSAKQLRGDSMADVIFNGSSARKPVGQASIELVFDNSDRRVAGQYAAYDEIAVRRLLQRDGQSIYYLNGTRCRRRDITDIFLGTGLGPRSYSIIEQGMISRVIEAGPEQLRAFLEEAAGISKYKERRRETEIRIRHTRDNLSRVNDLRDELSRQIERLQRQARNAERYRELKKEERAVKAGVFALRWREEKARGDELARAAAETQLQLERILAHIRSLEARMERGRVALTEANDRFGEVQGRYYGVGSEVARIEQAIRHARELRTRHQEDLQRADSAIGDLVRHAEADRGHIGDLAAYVEQNQPKLDDARAQESSARVENERAEQEQSRWREDWQDVQGRLAERQRAADLAKATIEHGDARLLDLEGRRRRLVQESQRLDGEEHGATIVALVSRLERLNEALELATGELGELDGVVTGLRATVQSEEAKLHELRESLHADQGRLASLETLQQAALNQDQDGLNGWLKDHGLADADRLAQGVDVEPGWETALESALAGRLDAVCVTDLDASGSSTGELSNGRITLFQPTPDQAAEKYSDRGGLLPIERLIRARWSVQSLLGGVFVANDCTEALSARQRLASHEWIVTRDGTRVGPNWLEFDRGGAAAGGILARARELETLAGRVSATRIRESEMRESIAGHRRVLLDREACAAKQRDTTHALRDERAHLSAELEGLRRRAAQTKERRDHLGHELAEVQSQERDVAASVAEARLGLEGSLDELKATSEERDMLARRGEVVKRRVTDARGAVRAARGRMHELSVQVESRKSSLESLRRGLNRIEEQELTLTQRREELLNLLAEAAAPVQSLTQELEQALETKAVVEEELSRARLGVEGADAELRTVDRERMLSEKEAESVRDLLEQRRVALGEAKVRCENHVEQLKELEVTPEATLSELPGDAEVGAWQTRLDTVGSRIQRLGAINLAAIDEFSRETERKAYLDAQYADLNEALTTLETAIGKIDRETRSRFQDVFMRVNDGLGVLFPRLFGGGQSFLEMVGEDELDAGVAVMARPPGKRISNIHLLSGGEKALTAVALVFAIFQLNPAPFCMLDEVDAPLDEANVGRFSDLVREMSGQVQFIVITHNKTTMEVLDHLVGVTMHEPGCSRLVDVDVDEAVRLAAV